MHLLVAKCSASERDFAGGRFNTGSVIGAVLAPPLIMTLMTTLGWRGALIISSVVGLLIHVGAAARLLRL